MRTQEKQLPALLERIGQRQQLAQSIRCKYDRAQRHCIPRGSNGVRPTSRDPHRGPIRQPNVEIHLALGENVKALTLQWMVPASHRDVRR